MESITPGRKRTTCWAIMGIAASTLLMYPSPSTALNVDPRYNVTCEPGQVVIMLSGPGNEDGLVFECQASAFTRTFQLQQLKEKAVISEMPLLGLIGYIGWSLNMYFDEALQVRKYQAKIAGYEDDAAYYQQKCDEYRQKSRTATSSKKRQSYREKADDYRDKARRASKRADEYRKKIRDIARKLDQKAPSYINVTTG